MSLENILKEFLKQRLGGERTIDAISVGYIGLDSGGVTPHGFVSFSHIGGSAGGSYLDEGEDPGSQRYELDDPEAPSFSTLKGVLKGAFGERGQTLFECAVKQANDTYERVSYDGGDCYGNYDEYAAYLIPYEAVVGELARAIRNDHKSWLAGLLNHEEREIRLLGSKLGAAWQSERAGLKI